MGKWLRKELVSIWPVFLFFLVGFLLLISLIKLALSEFSIQVTAVSRGNWRFVGCQSSTRVGRDAARTKS